MYKVFGLAFVLLQRIPVVLAIGLIGGLFLMPYAAGAALYWLGVPFSNWLYGLGAGSILLAIYLLTGTAIWTQIGMKRMSRTVERIASGDLTAAINVGEMIDKQEAETAGLWRSISQMNTNFIEIVNQVRASAEAIAASAKEIADGNTDLSHRTHEQASSLEETASGIEELAASAKQNANNCERANAMVGTASDVAGKAALQMADVSDTMKRIDESARHVADILSAIEGIAFQTNILALNAAVEAARAGEQGRGFAVVAAEVRSLAQRSGEAAKQIKALIDTSVGNVTQGKELVDAVGQTMGQVVDSVRQVQDVITEIALASSEQCAGVEDINKAIVQMDLVTQQNAALVEEAAAAALAFQDEAKRLVEVVGKFKTDRMEERTQAVAMVRRAVAHARNAGVRQALADFNVTTGAFNTGKFYIWVADFNGKVLANGSNPGGVGTEGWELAAADGRKFIQEIIHTAKTKGKGWCDYLWKNPVTGRTEQKSTYFEAFDNMFLACGIYQGKKEAPREQRPPTEAGTAPVKRASGY